MNNNLTPYPKNEDVFNDNKMENVFLSLCTVCDFSEEVTYPLHFVLPYRSWINDSYKTDKNSESFALFDIEKNKYTFNGDIRFYAPLFDGMEILNAVKNSMDKDIKYFLKRRNIKYFIHNLGFTDRGSSYEEFVQYLIEFGVSKHIYETKGKVAGYVQTVFGWTRLEKSPIVYPPNSKDFQSGFEEIKLNAKYLLPESIILDEWQPIGVVFGDEFLADHADTYLFWNKESHQALCVYAHS